MVLGLADQDQVPDTGRSELTWGDGFPPETGSGVHETAAWLRITVLSPAVLSLSVLSGQITAALTGTRTITCITSSHITLGPVLPRTELRWVTMVSKSGCRPIIVGSGAETNHGLL